MKKFFIQTFGCQMNVYDGWRIAAMLEHRGMCRTENISDADIIILNTCAVRAKATDKVFSALGRIRRAKNHLPCLESWVVLHANLAVTHFAESQI